MVPSCGPRRPEQCPGHPRLACTKRFFQCFTLSRYHKHKRKARVLAMLELILRLEATMPLMNEGNSLSQGTTQKSLSGAFSVLPVEVLGKKELLSASEPVTPLALELDVLLVPSSAHARPAQLTNAQPSQLSIDSTMETNVLDFPYVCRWSTVRYDLLLFPGDAPTGLPRAHCAVFPDAELAVLFD